MRRLATFGLLAVLLAVPASARYSMYQIYDATSAAAGSLDSGLLNTEKCSTLTVVMEAAGAAAPTGCAIKGARTVPPGQTPTEVQLATCNPAIAGVSFGCSIGINAGAGSPGVWPRTRVVGTGGAASTVRITVLCDVW